MADTCLTWAFYVNLPCVINLLSPMKLAIIIPAYNEEKSIHSVLKTLPRSIKGISTIIPIVIDDGSSDTTYELSKKDTKYVVQHVTNLGHGAAITTGFEAAKKLKCDIAITLDGDGQHNPKDIRRLLDPILKDKADIVIGTRMTNTAGMPLIKIFGNWLMNVLTFLIFQKWSTDTQSGMRAMNRKALSKLKLHSTGYEVCSEIIGEARRGKLRLTEVAIETIYTEYSKGKGQSWINGVNVLTRMLTIKMTGRK